MNLQKLKNNLLFSLGILLLVFAIVFPTYEVPLGIAGAIVVIAWLILNAKLKIKQIINFFRGY